MAISLLNVMKFALLLRLHWCFQLEHTVCGADVEATLSHSQAQTKHSIYSQHTQLQPSKKYKLTTHYSMHCTLHSVHTANHTPTNMHNHNRITANRTHINHHTKILKINSTQSAHYQMQLHAPPLQRTCTHKFSHNTHKPFQHSTTRHQTLPQSLRIQKS